MPLIPVNRDEIVPGRPLPWSAYNKHGRLLLRKGYVIETRRQLDALIERGIFHLSHDEFTARQARLEAEAMKNTPFGIIERLRERLAGLFERDHFTRDFVIEIVSIGRELQRACAIDEDAALATLFVMREGRYTVVHPVDTAVFCEVVMKYMPWAEQARLPVLAACLTMNLGMNELQEELYVQRGLPSAEQRKAIMEHPRVSHRLLEEAGVASTVWLDAVLCHHEHLDGSGYPDGLSGDRIPISARILSAGDLYCAKVAGRGYRRGIPPDRAMREIYLAGGRRFEEKIAATAVKRMGVYPPGLFVRLENGEVGVVTRRGDKAHCPVVAAVVDPVGAPYDEPRMRDTEKEGFAVSRVASRLDARTDFDLRVLWGPNAASASLNR
ncbi:MAG TPA: hypothetical protein ENJ37_09335 [Deltaproteobacteria bacterium]|nr:hypothetical protein [Deltaproteobacteria bacterium]